MRDIVLLNVTWLPLILHTVFSEANWATEVEVLGVNNGLNEARRIPFTELIGIFTCERKNCWVKAPRSFQWLEVAECENASDLQSRATGMTRACRFIFMYLKHLKMDGGES